MKKLLTKKIAVLGSIGAILGFTGIVIAAGTVALGNANSFAVLAGSGITNTGGTTITGDVGSYATLTQTGFGSITLIGTNHLGNTTTQAAKTALVTAYNDAASRPLDTSIIADLGGQTLAPGVYNTASSIGITGTVTLNGTASDVWIFQAGSTLTTAPSSAVLLTGGAQACNVFWQIGSSATLGTNTAFEGNILAFTSITLNTGTIVNGRVFAQNGAVTLDTNIITRSTCSDALPGTLHVVKHVINDNSGGASASNFTMHVSGTTNISLSSFAGSEAGTDVTLDAGSYTVTETGLSGYTESDSVGCTGVISAGETKTCTITDNDIYVAPVSHGGGGAILTQPTTPIIAPLVVTPTNTTTGYSANTFQAVAINPVKTIITPGLPNTGIPPTKEKGTWTRSCYILRTRDRGK